MLVYRIPNLSRWVATATPGRLLVVRRLNSMTEAHALPPRLPGGRRPGTWPPVASGRGAHVLDPVATSRRPTP